MPLQETYTQSLSAMPSVTTTCKMLLLQTTRLYSSPLLWVVVVTSVATLPQLVRSHGSHHSNPQRSHQQSGRASSSSSSAARHSGASTHDATSGFHDSKIVHDTELVHRLIDYFITVACITVHVVVMVHCMHVLIGNRHFWTTA